MVMVLRACSRTSIPEQEVMPSIATTHPVINTFLRRRIMISTPQCCSPHLLGRLAHSARQGPARCFPTQHDLGSTTTMNGDDGVLAVGIRRKRLHGPGTQPAQRPRALLR